jgi:hypothetical protein
MAAVLVSTIVPLLTLSFNSFAGASAWILSINSYPNPFY